MATCNLHQSVVPCCRPPPHTHTHTHSQIFYESLNFFYINVGLSAAGLSFVPSVPCPPVSEAVFNFMNAVRRGRGKRGSAWGPGPCMGTSWGWRNRVTKLFELRACD